MAKNLEISFWPFLEFSYWARIIPMFKREAINWLINIGPGVERRLFRICRIYGMVGIVSYVHMCSYHSIKIIGVLSTNATIFFCAASFIHFSGISEIVFIFNAQSSIRTKKTNIWIRDILNIPHFFCRKGHLQLRWVLLVFFYLQS